jgi:hypothetical protein
MLKDWFSSLPAYEHNAADKLSALVADCQHESLTGLLRFEFSSGELFLWTFINGEGKSLFEYENDKWLDVPRFEWMAKLEGCQANIRKSRIRIHGMRTCQVILAVGVEQKSPMRLSGDDLLQQVQDRYKQGEPGFIYLQAQGQELFGLMYGDGASNMEVLFIRDNEAVFSVEQPDDLPIRAGLEYQAEFYPGDKHQDIWLENRLRLAFAALVRMMIQRFGYMVGFSLADRLIAQLTEANQVRSLDIKLTSNGIHNNQLFHSLYEAREAYSFILNGFLDQASTLIGRRMSKEIAMNMLDKLSPAQVEVLVNNLRELNGPQFGMASDLRK